ncbi:MAG: hypothetical protein VZR27_01095 [Acutalibacteraceae bacterium]|nr:hypothetical protein [Acutalibacteraceae bacterium]
MKKQLKFSLKPFSKGLQGCGDRVPANAEAGTAKPALAEGTLQPF